MIMHPVDSTNVASVGYDPEKKELAVRFRNGATYVYSGVKPEEHEALVSADSVGRHFNLQFRNRSFRKQ
jgi:frataxin-like iron-binding protein CyaY